ncbi:MAG TPA: translocation/assembly module TamB domain-containing protein, partial [Stellaceae bacterium]|nr:translocation/assembly module TamB domain-containing protein [Stellaceae bacterium]
MTANQPPRPKKLLRRLALTLLAVVGVVAAVVAGGLWFLGSDVGSTWLTAQLESALAEPGRKATVTGLSGAPFRIRVRQVELAGADGPFLRLRDLALDIDASALLQGTGRIETLSAASIELLQSPPPSPQPSSPSSGFALPHLPLGIELDRLSVGRIDIAAAVAGTDVALAADGEGALHRDKARVALGVRRIDGVEGSLAVDATYDATAAPPRLDLAVHLTDPTGAALSALSAPQKPTKLDLTGAGPLAGWHGTLTGSAGLDSDIDATLGLARQPTALNVSLQGKARFAALLPEPWQAPVSDGLAFDVAAALTDSGAIDVDHVKLAAAASSVAANGRFDPTGDHVSGHAAVDGTLAPFAALAGRDLAGAVKLDLTVGGTVDAPQAQLALSGSGLASGEQSIAGLTASLRLDPAPSRRLHLTGNGRLDGVVTGAVPPDSVDWSLDVTSDRDGRTVDLAQVKLAGMGLDLAASGRLAGSAITGKAELAAADLSRFARLAGSARLSIDATSQDGTAATVHVSGTTVGLRLGIPAVDALVGPAASLDGTVTRDAAGAIEVSGLTAKGAAMSLDAAGRYDPTGDRISGKGTLALPDLRPLGRALGDDIAGAVTLTADGTGTAATLGLTGHVTAGAAKLDRIAAKMAIDDLSRRAARVTATIGSGTLDARLAAALSQVGDQLRIEGLSLTAPGTEAHGDLAIDISAGHASGTVKLHSSDLAPWSAVTGEKVAGKADLSLALDAKTGQSADATLAVQDAAFGDAASVKSLQATAHLADLAGRPRGNLRINARGAAAGSSTIEHAEVSAQSPDGKGFDLTLAGAGKIAGETFGITGAGTAQPGATERVTLARFSGKYHQLTFGLAEPLTATRAGSTVTLDGLELDVAGGHVSGHGRWDGKTVSAALKATALPVGAFAALAGHHGVSGQLGLDASVDGPVAAPDLHAVATLDRLKLGAGDVPAVDISARVDSAPGAIAFRGRVDAEKARGAIGFSGSVPIVFAPVPALRRDGPLQARLEGEGRLDALSELAPIGEDRISGGYTVDLTVAGTPASPQAGGKLTVTDGSYDNQLSGLTLRGLMLEVTGNERQFELTRLEANDGGTGRLTGSGRLDLAAAEGPRFDIKARVASFTGARSDLVKAVLSGDAQVSGAVAAPQVTGDLAIDRAELDLAEPLPPHIVVLDVVRVDSSRPRVQEAPP